MGQRSYRTFGKERRTEPCQLGDLSGCERTRGVSLHRMEPEIDTGPIVSQEVFEIGSEDTALSLSTKCVNVGVPIVMRFLEAVDPVGGQ